MILRRDLVKASNFFLSSNEELEYVEVWEDLNTNIYYIWDLDSESLFLLDHNGFNDFMDAAEAFEEDMINRKNQNRAKAMRNKIVNNKKHRKNRRIGAGKKINSLPSSA